jgi:hypothetical protein
MKTLVSSFVAAVAREFCGRVLCLHVFGPARCLALKFACHTSVLVKKLTCIPRRLCGTAAG